MICCCFPVRHRIPPAESEAQTETDDYKYNKLIKNNELITIHKKLTNKTKINDYIERIKFSCTKTKPISKISLLKLKNRKERE